jgi:hypothetical protein
VPDKQDRPGLALVALGADTIDVEACVTTVGPNRPRTQQNMVFLLVPDTVAVTEFVGREDTLFSTQQTRTQEMYKKLQDLARWVVAMRLLKEKPQDYGINASRLEEQEFDIRHAEREQALLTAVTQAYSSLWFPSASGHMRCTEIKTAGGEGGESTIELIRQELVKAGELVTAEHTGQSDLMSLSQLCAERHGGAGEAARKFLLPASLARVGDALRFRAGRARRSDQRSRVPLSYGQRREHQAGRVLQP